MAIQRSRSTFVGYRSFARHFNITCHGRAFLVGRVYTEHAIEEAKRYAQEAIARGYPESQNDKRIRVAITSLLVACSVVVIWRAFYYHAQSLLDTSVVLVATIGGVGLFPVLNILVRKLQDKLKHRFVPLTIPVTLMLVVGLCVVLPYPTHPSSIVVRHVIHERFDEAKVLASAELAQAGESQRSVCSLMVILVSAYTLRNYSDASLKERRATWAAQLQGLRVESEMKWVESEEERALVRVARQLALAEISASQGKLALSATHATSAIDGLGDYMQLEPRWWYDRLHILAGYSSKNQIERARELLKMVQDSTRGPQQRAHYAAEAMENAIKSMPDEPWTAADGRVTQSAVKHYKNVLSVLLDVIAACKTYINVVDEAARSDWERSFLIAADKIINVIAVGEFDARISMDLRAALAAHVNGLVALSGARYVEEVARIGGSWPLQPSRDIDRVMYARSLLCRAVPLLMKFELCNVSRELMREIYLDAIRHGRQSYEAAVAKGSGNGGVPRGTVGPAAGYFAWLWLMCDFRLNGTNAPGEIIDIIVVETGGASIGTACMSLVLLFDLGLQHRGFEPKLSDSVDFAQMVDCGYLKVR